MSAKDMPVLAHVAVAAAAVRARFGNATDAARALGAGEQLRGAPDPRNPEVVRLADRLRADVGDAAYDLAYATGEASFPDHQLLWSTVAFTIALSVLLIVGPGIPYVLAVPRGIDLSKEKYCSVWHSMRHDIPFDVTFTVTPGV